MKTGTSGRQRVQEQVMMTVKRQKSKSSGVHLSHSNRGALPSALGVGEAEGDAVGRRLGEEHGQHCPDTCLCPPGSMYDGLADSYSGYGTTGRSSYYSKFQAGTGSWGYPVRGCFPAGQGWRRVCEGKACAVTEKVMRAGRVREVRPRL
ncbi:Plakophilin-1 [Camelus dromedarius]|uniref:Plakophilin-1 n=1 Tax=Camelus dromedarius TaxID=9838 RepID=A0A5N4CIS0_CAMDR|nr:Plakophilin-1 [Camelus dromedarius]